VNRIAMLSVAATATLTLTLAAPVARAQEPGTNTRHVEGTVYGIGPDELVLGTQNGIRRFAITAETRQQLGFRVGDTVDVGYMKGGAGGEERLASSTVEGTVLGITPEELVLATRSGVRHYAITAETTQPLDFHVGDNVNVAYRRELTGGAETLASSNLSQPPASTSVAMAAPAASAPMAEPMAPAEEPVQVAQAPAATEPSEPPATVSSSMAPANQAGELRRLPQTASNLPLIGLIGLISLAGAAALRLFARA
jgi:hypothetical protein